MDSTHWRIRGENHFNNIATVPSQDDAILQALQAIYCELRFANDGGGESSKAIANLSHALGEAFPR